MEYTIVKAFDLGEFTKLVNEHIKKGWKPQGGICVASLYTTFLQAMIRFPYLDKEKE